jgi:hypothetical protein
MPRILPAVIFVLALAGAAPAAAQDAPAPRATDVATIDSIIPVLYAVISGPVGQPRQWDRMKSLFHPQARLMPTGCDTAGRCTVRILTPDDYRQRADSFLVSTGFRELEIARRVERYGNVAHVWSTYESYRRDEKAPFTRGINSIQLLWDGSRWWITSVFWDSERAGNRIPAQYLRSPGRGARR